MRTITLGHSPDPDDAFMFYALAAGAIPTGPYRFVHELADIETLNRRALAEELDLTAVSFAAYPHLARSYQLLACGASVGDGYGPLLVGRSARVPIAEALAQATIAIPGQRTTAALALRLYAAAVAPGLELRTRVVPFDRILDEVRGDGADLGLLIHEGQLTYAASGLEPVVDLGRWWRDETGYPLPLGGNAVRRGLGPETIADVCDCLRASIEYGLAHRREALAHAGSFGRGLDAAATDRFVGMYVYEWTLDLGDRGRRAVALLLERAHAAGLVPAVGEIDFARGRTGERR